MPYRLTKIYTRKGDEGYTTLGDNRISKDDLLVEAIGNLDELNASVGMIIALKIQHQDIENHLTQIQHELFDLGGELHLPQYIAITPEHIARLENILDGWNATLPPLEEFILPRGTPTSVACHLARTICRRAERSLVRLHRQVPLNNPQLLCYLNRLSDVLFVAARILARESDQQELLWEHERK